MGYFPDSVLLKVGWRALSSSRAACIASALALSLKTHSVSRPVGTRTSSYLLFFVCHYSPFSAGWRASFQPFPFIIKNCCSCLLRAMWNSSPRHVLAACLQWFWWSPAIWPSIATSCPGFMSTWCLASYSEPFNWLNTLWWQHVWFQTWGGAVLLYWMSPVHFTNNRGCWWSSCFQPEVMLSCIVRLSPYH